MPDYIKLLCDLFDNVAGPNDVVQRGEGKIYEKLETMTPPKPSKLAAVSALSYLARFMGVSQLTAIRQNFNGEEGDYFKQMMIDLREFVEAMPDVRFTIPNQNMAQVYLHYFTGSCDWYILAKDYAYDSNPEGRQHQAFGWANLGDDATAEVGYISIEELIGLGVELDLHWDVKSLDEAINYKKSLRLYP